MKCSMIESGTAKVCPYCEGKGYVSALVELPAYADFGKLSGTTWVRRTCPLCDGKGQIFGDNSSPTFAREKKCDGS